MNPYLMPEPCFVSFSGGRTSGYMLSQIIAAHDGTLPAHVHVGFMNTGKEKPETLDFVKECGERWGVKIRWLEYTREHDGTAWKSGVKEVTYETAARNGEPFASVIAGRNYLPNVVTRFCTVELKVRTMKRWMMAQAYDKWTNAVGIRADEPGRLIGKGDQGQRWHRVCPLAEAEICVEDVMGFWAKQPFDLRLRQDQGNCDLCFLKGRKKLKRLIKEDPTLCDWWIQQEEHAVRRAASPILARFNKDISVRQIRDAVFSLPLYEQVEECELDEVADCHCTD